MDIEDVHVGIASAPARSNHDSNHDRRQGRPWTGPAASLRNILQGLPGLQGLQGAKKHVTAVGAPGREAAEAGWDAFAEVSGISAADQHDCGAEVEAGGRERERERKRERESKTDFLRERD